MAAIRAFFAIGSKTVPGPTGRTAFRLFCTTFAPRKKSTQHKAILENAQRMFDTGTHHKIAYSGGTVSAFEFQPTTATTAIAAGTSPSAGQLKTVWLVHGWQSHSLFMSQFVEPLLASGIRVISIDLPGHGQSSGKTFHLPLAVDALHAVKTTLGDFHMIVSHSLGGAVVATTLAGTMPDYPALPAEKLVLISSPDSMEKIFNDFASMINLGKQSTESLHAEVTRLSGKLTAEFATSKQLQNVSTDLLIIHAPDDKEVPYSEAEAIAAANPKATLNPMPGLGHRRIIASKDVVQNTVEFLTQPAG